MMTNPPAGYLINQETGAISGICLSPENTQVNSTIMISSASVITITLSFNIVGYDSFAPGIATYYAESSDEAMVNTTIDDIYAGKISVKGQLLSTATITCGDSSACPFDLKSEHIYFYMYGAFKVETAGTYSFKIDAIDHGVVFIDSLTEKSITTAYEQPYYITKELTAGVHFIAVLNWNDKNSGALTISYHKPSDAEEVYNVFTFNTMKSLPLPLQFVVWRTKSLIFTIGTQQTLTPVITGYAYQFASSPDLPSGMSFDYRGQINGIPKIVSDKNTYTISVYSWDNSQVIKTAIDIQVNDKSVESMKQGLDGYYYTSPTRGCEFTEIDTSSDILKFRRFDTTINRISTEVSAWNGLSGEFINQYIVKWEGLLYVPRTATYRITITTYGGVRLEINNQIIQTTTCGYNTATNIVDLEIGLVSITMYYWKSSGDTLKSLSLQWETTDGFMRLTQIPDSYFYNNPRYTFSYQYVVASYIKEVAITINCPVFSTIEKTEYSNYKVSPDFPLGLSFDANGCITGSIVDTKTSLDMTKYEITITKITDPDEEEKATIEISYDTYTTPQSIQYPVMVFTIGVYASYAPTSIIADHYTVQVSDKSLPSGLSLNSATGVISGTPTESVVAPSNTFNILVTNPVGSCTGIATITVNDCSNNGYFYQFNYISGTGSSLTLVSLTAGSQLAYYNTTHSSDTYHSVKACSNSPQLSITFQQNGGRVGTYSVYGKGNNMFKYGRWSQSGNTVVTISLDTVSNIPSISYEQTSLTLVYGETVSILPDIVSGAVTSFELYLNTELPDGLNLNQTNGAIYGTVAKVSETKSGTFQIIGKNGELSSTAILISYVVYAECQNNQILLSITAYGGTSGQYMYISVTSPIGIEVFGQNGLGNGKSSYYSACSDPGYYSLK